MMRVLLWEDVHLSDVILLFGTSVLHYLLLFQYMHMRRERREERRGRREGGKEGLSYLSCGDDSAVSDEYGNIFKRCWDSKLFASSKDLS